jgi:hypothetical protein
MKITYAIWKGSNLLSVGNVASTIKEVDKVIAELNDSKVAKQVPFSANIQSVEVSK